MSQIHPSLLHSSNVSSNHGYFWLGKFTMVKAIMPKLKVQNESPWTNWWHHGGYVHSFYTVYGQGSLFARHQVVTCLGNINMGCLEVSRQICGAPVWRERSQRRRNKRWAHLKWINLCNLLYIFFSCWRIGQSMNLGFDTAPNEWLRFNSVTCNWILTVAERFASITYLYSLICSGVVSWYVPQYAPLFPSRLSAQRLGSHYSHTNTHSRYMHKHRHESSQAETLINREHTHKHASTHTAAKCNWEAAPLPCLEREKLIMEPYWRLQRV